MSSTVKVIVGRDGVNLLGEGRARLLELLEEKRSLRKAASDMGMSYRYAWGAIKHLEEVFGLPLVVSKKGGSSGGSTVLTPEGKELLEEYRRVRSAAISAADGELMRVTVILAASDDNDRFVSIDGRLPWGRVSVSEPPETVLTRLIKGMDLPCHLFGGPSVRMGKDGGLFLVYKASVTGSIVKGRSLKELGPEDRVLLE